MDPHPSQLGFAKSQTPRCTTFPFLDASHRRGKGSFGCCWSPGGMPGSSSNDDQHRCWQFQEPRATHSAERPSARAMTCLPLRRVSARKGEVAETGESREAALVIVEAVGG